MKNRSIDIYADYVVVGGGLPGMCSAIQAARMGLKTVLINNRPYFGGNASAELMISVGGATWMQEFNFHARETGVIEEILLEDQKRNPHDNRWIWNTVLLDILMKEKNLTLYPNTCIDEVVKKKDDEIEYVAGLQITTETNYRFHAPIFADDTGDGTVAYLSGAEYRYGREAKAEFHERIAPDVEDSSVLPSTMVFFADKRDYPVPYYAPAFATDITKTYVLDYREIPQKGFEQFQWFYEIDGRLDQVYEAETITEHHRALVYGIWDYIKNSGKYPAENYELSYISPIPGKRESRRFLGDYILTESDIVNRKEFPDVIGHGGWSIDLHAIDGFYAKEPINKHIFLKGIYQIPYRCCYSKDISNLFLIGRCMSVSHVALGTVRLEATLSELGQANAVAAYLCKKYNCKPRDIYDHHLKELQQLLLKYDQFVVGCKYQDDKNIVEKADIQVSSERALAQTEGDTAISLGNALGISLPVKEKFKGIRLFYKSEKDSRVVFKIYKSEKVWGYEPSCLIYQNEAEVKAADEFTEVTLYADLALEAGYYFVVLEGADNITFKANSTKWTGVETCCLLDVNQDNYVDLDSLEPRNALWTNYSGTICFELLAQEKVFGKENLVNGYTRPYIQPNIWHSEGLEKEYIELQWEEPVSVSEITIILDSYLNEALGGTRSAIRGPRPSIIKDYDVLVWDQEGTFEKVAEIRDNCQRVNTISVDTREIKGLKIIPIATNGQAFYSIYEIRVFG